jgi:hypothetical protein
MGGVVAYLSAQNIIREERPDRVYFMNGRWAWTRAIFRACLEAGVDCWAHERGSTGEKYALFRNHLPQDIDRHADLIRDAWHAATTQEREQIAEDWFRRRAAGDAMNWLSFVGDQQAGRLPDNWMQDRINFGIFTSSLFEFNGIDSRQRWAVYPNQLAGIRTIADEVESWGAPYHLYIRIHPNQARNLSEVAPLLDLRRANVTVIPPDSVVSTYALLTRVATAITFGSTVGVEATFWRTPSILLSTALYQDLGAVYRPLSHDETLAHLARPLAPKPYGAALMFGYYNATFGIAYQRYKSISPGDGLYNGRSFEEYIPWVSKVKAAALRRIPSRVWDSIGKRRQLRRIAELTSPAGGIRGLPEARWLKGNRSCIR